MGELRIDPLSGLRVLLAPDRADRPGHGLEHREPPPAPAPDNPFAPGREAETGEELARVPADGPWQARAFANRFPALTADSQAPPREAKLDLFTSGAATGRQEVIVNAAQPVAALADLGAEQVALAMGLWRARIAAHPGAAHVHLAVNEGREGGASQPHTHAQLWALDFVPAAIARERERFGAYAARNLGANLLGDLVQEEVRLRVRLVAYDDEAVLLSPYAPRFPFQLMVVPRATARRFEDPGPLGAKLLHRGLRALRARFGASPPLTISVRTAPRGAETFCWRIDVMPRLFAEGGLELGTGVPINPVAPERAAAELKAALG